MSCLPTRIRIPVCNYAGVQPIVHGDINETGDNIDCDRFSAVSEVYQAEQIEDDQIVDQGQLEYVSSHSYFRKMDYENRNAKLTNVF